MEKKRDFHCWNVDVRLRHEALFQLIRTHLGPKLPVSITSTGPSAADWSSCGFPENTSLSHIKSQFNSIWLNLTQFDLIYNWIQMNVNSMPFKTCNAKSPKGFEAPPTAAKARSTRERLSGDISFATKLKSPNSLKCQIKSLKCHWNVLNLLRNQRRFQRLPLPMQQLQEAGQMEGALGCCASLKDRHLAVVLLRSFSKAIALFVYLYIFVRELDISTSF